MNHIRFKSDEKITFQMLVREPEIIKEHLIKDSENKHKVVACSGDDCEYCITCRTLLKMNKFDVTAKSLMPRKRYELPIIVSNNDIGAIPGEYIYSFNGVIYKAYIQLMVDATHYKFNPDKHTLLFKHSPTTVSSTWPEYDTCSFEFGNPKKPQTVTVKQLLRDSERVF